MRRILAMDIGHGTKDILLYDARRNTENQVKLVVPSPAKIWADRLLRADRDVFLTGDTIGGGPLAYAMRELVKRGRRVRATRAASYILRNNDQDVEDAGVEVLDEEPAAASDANDAWRIELDEMEIPRLRAFLSQSDESLDELDAVVFAVQDHGAYPAGEKNRVTRFRTFHQRLSADPHPWALAFTPGDLPAIFHRMRSGLERLAGEFPGVPLLASDTPMAALMGCHREDGCAGFHLIVNVGNCHVMAAVFHGDRIHALYEHHTRMFRKRPAVLAEQLRRFAAGDLSDGETREDGGEGTLYLETPPGYDAMERTLVTGPNRMLLRGTAIDARFPAPGGDMMMTGPLGLVSFAERKLGAGRTDGASWEGATP